LNQIKTIYDLNNRNLIKQINLFHLNEKFCHSSFEILNLGYIALARHLCCEQIMKLDVGILVSGCHPSCRGLIVKNSDVERNVLLYTSPEKHFLRLQDLLNEAQSKDLWEFDGM